MNGSPKGYRGYLSMRPVHGSTILTAVQTMILRQYAAENHMIFKLPPTEPVYPRCYLELEGILAELDNLDGILMCSFFMLPQRVERRRSFYERVFSAHASVHFVLDRHVIRGQGDETKIEELFSILKTLERCPRSFPRSRLTNECEAVSNA